MNSIHHINCSISDIKEFLKEFYGWKHEDFEDYEDFTRGDWIKEIRDNFSLQDLADFLAKR